MNLFRRDTTPFITDLPQYAGNYRGEKRGYKWWEVRDPSREPFKSILEAVFNGLNHCPSIPPSVLVLVDIFLRGRNLQSCILCVMLGGATERHRKSGVRHIRRSQPLRQYSGLKMDQWDWPPQAPDVRLQGQDGQGSYKTLVFSCREFDIRRRESRKSEATAGITNDPQFYMIAKENINVSTRAGVVCCAVMVGGELFLLAPAHIFMPRPTNDATEQSDSENVPSSVGSSSNSDLLREASSTPLDIRSVSSPSTASDTTAAGLEEESASDARNRREDGENSSNLPPLFPVPDGFAIFSPELDYAAIPSSVSGILRGFSFARDLAQLSLHATQRIDSGQTLVIVNAPSCGLIDGWIDGRPTYMRLPYARKVTKLYPISLPDALGEGDCGTPVRDKITKKIYGFIAAASVEGRVAYMIPAEEVVHDITERLGGVCVEREASEKTPLIYGTQPLPLDNRPSPATKSAEAAIKYHFREEIPAVRRKESAFGDSEVSENARIHASQSLLNPGKSSIMGALRVNQQIKRRLRRDSEPSDVAAAAEGARPRKRRGSIPLPNTDMSKKDSAVETEDNMLFACPFYKRNPAKYPTCQPKILKKVSRIKAHLWRCHMRPIHCVRCQADFKTQEERDKHERGQPPCQLVELKVGEWVTTYQKELLSKRFSSKTSPQEQWYRIYSILFPGEPAPESPYTLNALTEGPAASQIFTEYKSTAAFIKELDEMFPELSSDQEEAIQEYKDIFVPDAMSSNLHRVVGPSTAAISSDSGYTTLGARTIEDATTDHLPHSEEPAKRSSAAGEMEHIEDRPYAFWDEGIEDYLNF